MKTLQVYTTNNDPFGNPDVFWPTPTQKVIFEDEPSTGRILIKLTPKEGVVTDSTQAILLAWYHVQHVVKMLYVELEPKVEIKLAPGTVL